MARAGADPRLAHAGFVPSRLINAASHLCAAGFSELLADPDERSLRTRSKLSLHHERRLPMRSLARLTLRLATISLAFGVACSSTDPSAPDVAQHTDGPPAGHDSSSPPDQTADTAADSQGPDMWLEGGSGVTDGAKESSARIELQIVDAATLTIKATSCTGLSGTWSGTMVMSAGGSGSGTFSMSMPATGTGTFSFDFPVVAGGQTAQYKGTATATLQSSGTQMALQAAVTVITAFGTSNASFSEVTPVIRGNNPACGGK